MSYILYTSLLALGHISNGLPQDKPIIDPKDFVALTSESRIVGGNDAPDGYAPHMAALLYGQVFTVMLCGGSIISSKHVLTAAHCIDSAIGWQGGLSTSLHGVIGSNRWESTNSPILFASYTNHPLWDPTLVKYDVGVLTVAQAMVLTGPHVAVVPLENGVVGGGIEASVTGWGRIGLYPAPVPDKLQYLHLTTLSWEQCLYDLEAIEKVWGPGLPFDSKVEICTFHSCGRGMCHGDSGSALVSKLTGKQIGVVSWGRPCALGAPDVYTRISAVIDFLNRILMER